MYFPKPAKIYLPVLIALICFFVPDNEAQTQTANSHTLTKAYQYLGFTYASNRVNDKDRTVRFTKPVIALTATPTIIATTATGTINACVGSASASPQLQQFMVTGNNLTGDITASAPSGFELSLNAVTGYGTDITLTQTGGTLNNTIVYVRSSASAPTGNITGNVTLSSAGAQSQTVSLTGIVNALPTINQVAGQTVANGSTTNTINFSGSGNTAFNWVNDTPGIGLAASGSGDIGSFTAVNSGTSPVTATITATPVSVGYAYITNAGDGTISVMNVATNKIESVITPPHDPFCVCISPDGSKAYVGCGGGSSTVTVINTITNAIITTIPVSAAGEATGIVVSPDNATLYVANYVTGTVSAVDIATSSVVAVIPVAANPYGLAISPDGKSVYVAFTYINKISVINTSLNIITTDITIASAAPDIAVSPNGKIYIPVSNSNNVAIVDPISNNIIGVIPNVPAPGVIAISPDGTRVYGATGSNNVSVINTATNAIISTITVGTSPNGICFSPDGHFVYVTNTASNNVSVINTSTNVVIATVRVGTSPISLGNFVTAGTGCTGTPTTFTITVNPNATTSPTISAGNVSGNIYSCSGTASASPNLQQFTVSGSSLTGDISATAPAGFEISTSPNASYASTLTLAKTGSTVSTTSIYVRTTVAAAAGILSRQVSLSSPGAGTINAAVQGQVFGPAMVNAIQPQTVTNESQTSVINFTGTATTYNWVNDTPAIGLPASGSGNIASFAVVNNGSTPITATITVTPITQGGANGSNLTCTGSAGTFTITVNPSPLPGIKSGGTLLPLTTTYGTPSLSTALNISGSSLTEGIQVTPPPGFEVSTDKVTFAGTLTLGAGGNISTTPVYIRLAAATPVGVYSGNIMLSSGGIYNIEVALPAGKVNPALLTIIADNKSKVFGAVNPILTASYTGFVNNEGPAQLTNTPLISTLAIATSPVGQYPITVSGAISPDYTFNYVTGVLTIAPALLVIPNTFTPNGDGINDTWNIKYLEIYSNCMVNIFNRYGELLYSSIGYTIPWDGKYKGANLPAGTYYYLIDTKSSLKTLAGYITIIR